MKKQILFIVMVLSAIGIGAVAENKTLRSLGFIAPQINDKDNVSNPAAGEILYDSSDSTFWGRTDLATWVPLNPVSAPGVPTGTILPFAGTSAPTGYLIADGASVLKADYPDLYAAIGDAFGSVDSTHFNLPDLRGRFLRGVDGGTGRDPDAGSRTAMNAGGNTGNNVGTLQGDIFGSHQHTGRGRTADVSFPVSGDVGLATDTGVGINANLGPTGGTRVRPTTGAFDASGGNETRPKNAYVNFIIKT